MPESFLAAGRRLRLGALAAVLAACSMFGAHAGLGHAACPTSSISLLGNSWVGDAPAMDWSADDYYASASAYYDLRVGMVYLRAATSSSEGHAGGTVAARDSFRLVGLPAGSVVQVTARIGVEARLYGDPSRGGASARTRVWLTHPASGRSVAWDSLAFADPFFVQKNFDLDLPLEIVAGESFLLELGAASESGGQSSSGSSTATLAFPGLPLGAVLTSCQGYSTGTTAVLASVQGTRVEDGRVTITWHAPGLSAWRPRLSRRTEGGDWTSSGAVAVTEGDLIHAIDASVSAGTRYGYRLDWEVGDGTTLSSPEAWVSVPASAHAAGVRVLSNPAHGRLELELQMPELDRSGELALLDVSGRILSRLGVTDSNGGRLTWPGLDGLPPGVYWIRWELGGRTGGEKVAIVR